MSDNAGEILRQTYLSQQGKEAVILACGPSIGMYDRAALQAAMRRHSEAGRGPIMTVKQAVNLLPDGPVDWHFFNECNYQRVVYPNPRPIIVASYGVPLADFEMHCHRADRDMLIEVTWRGKHEDGLAYGGHIEDGILPHDGRPPQARRPGGVGIVTESVLYVCVHLGVSAVSLYGWDGYGVNDKSAPQLHFYKPLPLTIHGSGCIPTAEVIKTEMVSSLLWYNWLSSHGITLRCMIPRPGAPCHRHPSILRAVGFHDDEKNRLTLP